MYFLCACTEQAQGVLSIIKACERLCKNMSSSNMIRCASIQHYFHNTLTQSFSGMVCWQATFNCFDCCCYAVVSKLWVWEQRNYLSKRVIMEIASSWQFLFQCPSLLGVAWRKDSRNIVLLLLGKPCLSVYLTNMAQIH